MTTNYVICTKSPLSARSARQIFEYGTVKKKNKEEDSCYCAELHKTKMDSVSLHPWRLCCLLQCLVKFFRRDTHVIECSHEDLDAQQLVSIMCTEKFMRQLHVKSVMNLIHRTTMTQRWLCLHTSAMTWNYIYQRLWKLRGTTRFRPNLNCFYDITKDWDQLSIAYAA